jgi:hypothetical protein
LHTQVRFGRLANVTSRTFRPPRDLR